MASRIMLGSKELSETQREYYRKVAIEGAAYIDAIPLSAVGVTRPMLRFLKEMLAEVRAEEETRLASEIIM